jgi:transketolase
MFDLPSTRDLAQQLRVDAIRIVAAAGSGHPTSALSAADLMAVLLARHLRYSVKSLDRGAVIDAASATGRLVIAEDHWAQGGLAAAVLEALADAGVHAQVERLAITAMPTRRPDELLRWAGIDRTRIAERALALVGRTTAESVT